MATSNLSFTFNGNFAKEEADKIIDEINSNQMFSGSIECIHGEEFKSTYVFRFVNSDMLMYILNELNYDVGEVKVEIQRHDENAKDVQSEGFISGL